MDGTILLADDDRTIRTVLTQALTRAGCKVHATSSLVTLMRWVEEGRGDLVISDVIMPDGNGIDALPEISRKRPNLPVIVISANNTIVTTIKATEAQAFDYLPKPFDLPDLLKCVSAGLSLKRRVPSAGDTVGGNVNDLPLVGQTTAMQTLYRSVAKVMNTDIPVLITGESGTGKTLIAHVIHDFSDRRTGPLITVGAHELESNDDAQSLINRSRNGTLLLDEVCDVSSDGQANLVRMLDGLGEDAPRILATSQANLTVAMDQGAFRQDLYYRLAGLNIPVPPLQDRMEDIQLLANHFLHRFEADGLPQVKLSDQAIDALRSYQWPGNVRQLENVLRQLALSAAHDVISLPETDAALAVQPKGAASNSPDNGEKLSASVHRHLQRYFDLHGDALPPQGLYQRILREFEEPMISIALDATQGNQAKCADLLGINRNTLRKKITDLDIRVTRRRKLM